jgi:hypothetical protein
MTDFERAIKQRVTLSLSTRYDKNGLSDCHVLNDALEVYRFWLQQNQATGIGDAEYNNPVYAIISGIRHELTAELLKITQPTDEEDQEDQ